MLIQNMSTANCGLLYFSMDTVYQTKKDKEKLEKVQRRYTKINIGCKEKPMNKD